MDQLFFQPRLTGARFDDHAMPVDLLSDFVALEELIVELAKQKYFDAHPDRKRVPRGFADQVSLKLARLDEGSVLPGFILVSALAVSGSPSEYQENLTYFEQAKQQIIQTISNAQMNERVVLAPKYISYFNRIGKNLKDDEGIEFNPTSVDHKAILTKRSRRTLLLSTGDNAEFLDNTVLIARITELDKAKQTFSLENHTIKLSGVHIPKEHKETIYSAFNQFENGNYVKINGVAKFTASNIMNMVTEIEQLDMLDADDIEVRLEQISALKAGWYYGEGACYDAHKLNAFLELFNAYYSNELPNPKVYPSIDGTIQLEWTNDTVDISVSISPESLLGSYHMLTFVSKAEEEQDLDLNLEHDWSRLSTMLQQYYT